MTIYRCKVSGCSSNNKINSNLKFFVLPKDEERAKLWLKVTSQDGLDTVSTITCPRLRDKFRVCSLHFSPNSIRNQRLADDAVPRFNLPAQSQDIEDQDHHGVACDVCGSIISGYRYKCVQCNDYDLCQKCEKSEDHQNHFLIRITKPITSFENTTMFKNLKSALHPNTSNHKEKVETKTATIDSDSDNEPITKYQKNSLSELELSSDKRTKISNEVNRVLKLLNKKRKTVEGDKKMLVKKIKKNVCTISTQTPIDSDSSSESAHEVEFADVNDFKNEKPGEEEPEEIKTEMDSILYTMLS